MTRSLATTILIASGLAFAAPPPQPPPPNLIDLYRANSDPALPPLPSDFSYSVGLFAFSPDEQWLGVVLLARRTQSGKTPAPDSILLLVPLQGGDSRRIRIDPSLGTSVLWAPDSKSVAIQRYIRGHDPIQIYNLSGELISTGPPTGLLLGFIAPGRLLALRQKADGKRAGFEAIDVRTSAITPWRAPKRRNIEAIDSERGLVAMFPDAEGSKTLIVDYATGKVAGSVKNQDQVSLPECVHGLSYDDSHPGDCAPIFTPTRVYFAEDGRALCQAAMVGAFKTYPACQDIETGKTIAEFRGFSGGAPAAASARSSRMVLTKLNYLPSYWGAFGEVQSGLGAETYESRVVWDFRSGVEVAAWAPSTQPTSGLFTGQATGRSAPAVAISSFGHYVAEVLGDEVHIYQIP